MMAQDSVVLTAQSQELLFLGGDRGSLNESFHVRRSGYALQPGRAEGSVG